MFCVNMSLFLTFRTFTNNFASLPHHIFLQCHFSGDTLSHFNVHSNLTLTRFDGYHMQLSVDDCASKCLSEFAFYCDTFSYCSYNGACYMSNSSIDSLSNMELTPHRLCFTYASKFEICKKRNVSVSEVFNSFKCYLLKICADKNSSNCFKGFKSTLSLNSHS